MLKGSAATEKSDSSAKDTILENFSKVLDMNKKTDVCSFTKEQAAIAGMVIVWVLLNTLQ